MLLSDSERSVQVINPTIDPRWDSFVSENPLSTIFHTSMWSKVIQNSYGYEPFYVIIVKDGTTQSGFPFFLIKNWLGEKRLISLPFTDECILLFNQKEDKYRQDDLQILINLIKIKKINNIELRTGISDFLPELGFKTHFYYKIFKLDLSCGLDNLRKNFKQKSIRYPIRKAQRYGVEIIKTSEPDGMEIFYKLNLFTRRKHGVIPQPYEFFKNILTEIFNTGFGFLLIANYKKRPVGASIFFTFKKVLYHKFNASDINYLAYQPNHLILWHAIQWAVENGYKTLDLGRTSPDNRGLMAFKRHWGAEEIDLPYYYWPEIRGASATKESSKKYKIASSVLRKMPIPILKISGNLLYKYFG